MSRLAILHEHIFDDPNVGVDEIAVVAVLALHSDKNGVCWPSQGLIADILGKSRPWVCAVIARLVSIGMVEKTDRQRHDGGRRTSLYRLKAPPEIATSAVNIPESSARRADDKGSQSVDSGCHERDINKEPKENIQDSLSACAHDDESIVAVQEVPGVAAVPVRENKVAVTPEADWQPNDEDLIYGLERFPEADLQEATERFVGRCRAKGYRYLDLSAAWRVWLAEDQAAERSRVSRFRHGVGQRASAAERRFGVWASVARAASGSGVRHAA